MYRVKQEQATKANLVVEVSGRVIEYISQEAKALFNCSDKQGKSSQPYYLKRIFQSCRREKQ